MTTDISAEAIQELLEGVTPGPWKAVDAADGDDVITGFDWYLYSPNYGAVGYWTGHKANHKDERWLLTEPDARFIAAARELIPALSAALEAEKAENKLLRAGLSKANQMAENYERSYYLTLDRAEAAEKREVSLKASIQETREAVAEAASLRHRLKVAEGRIKGAGNA